MPVHGNLDSVRVSFLETKSLSIDDKVSWHKILKGENTPSVIAGTVDAPLSSASLVGFIHLSSGELVLFDGNLLDFHLIVVDFLQGSS
jgi:hypothetical protein